MTISDVVFFSGGIGSWAAAKRVAQRPHVDRVVLLFADTLIEDEDLYRFLDDAVENVRQDAEVQFEKIADGRDPWEVFKDVKFIGNSRIDPCSRILKRELLEKWRNKHCDPSHATLHFGIDWTEKHRLDRVQERTPEWKISAPMCEAPMMTKKDMLSWALKEELKPPRLYELGFHHNNCGGFCIKAGQAQFELLLRTMPERYAYHEQQEEEFQATIGKPATVLRDRRKGETTPLSLKEFRLRLEAQPDLFDKFEWGGCGCAIE